MKDTFLPAISLGFVIGALVIGMGMTHIGPNSRAKVDAAKAECELNIPRNQTCVIQFIPEGNK